VSRIPITLPAIIEAISDEPVKVQLRAIGERIRDIITTGVGMARNDGALTLLLAAHGVAVRIFEAESAAYFKYVTGGEELLRSFACKPGCIFCCHLYVEVTSLEVVAVWNKLREGGYEAQRERVTANASRVMGLRPDKRREAKVPCAMLVDGACSIYETRPFACRGLYSTSAQACEEALNTPAGAPLPPIRSPALPRVLSAVLGVGINAALGDSGIQNETLELTTALDTLERNPDLPIRWLAGERVFPKPF
jgi:hypothetical protein